MLFGNDKLNKAVEDAAWEIDNASKNDLDIIRGISEYLQRNVKYDHKKINCRYNHDAYGALISHCAVCDGISKAFKLIADFFGYKCLIVEGKKRDDNFSFFIGHAWNIIEYEGDFYHIDATWDTNIYEVTNEYSYSYFGLSDAEISIDHKWNKLNTPKCVGTKLSFFHANNLFAIDESQITRIMVRGLKNKDRIIRLKISEDVVLPKDEEEYMKEKLEESIETINSVGQYSVVYSWNREQRTFIAKIN